MTTPLHVPGVRRTGRLAGSATAAALPLSAGLLVTTSAPAHAATAVSLGTAERFAVLAGSGVTNTGATRLGGDLGTFPTTSVTGGDSLVFTSGADRGGGAVTQQAKTDLQVAYDRAAGQASSETVTADLGGRRLTTGATATPTATATPGATPTPGTVPGSVPGTGVPGRTGPGTPTSGRGVTPRPTPSLTSRQVTRVPAGGVATGDGTTGGAPSSVPLLGGSLVLGAAAGAAALLRRRRPTA